MGSAHDYEWPDYESRIDTIGQNGNEGLHYEKEQQEWEVNKYKRKVGDTGLYLDVYDVIAVFDINNPALQHALKKILCTGQRGYKDFEQDTKEAIQALERAPDVQKLMELK